MDIKELLELFKHGHYELIIEEAKGSKDSNKLFLVLRSYSNLGMFKNALVLYKENSEILESANLIEAIKIYLYLLINSNATVAQINDAIEHFKDFNYVNQETEEFICNIDNYVKTVVRSKEPTQELTVDEIIKMLSSDSEIEVIEALNEVATNDKLNFINFKETVANILSNKSELNFATAILLDFLTASGYKGSFILKKKNIYIRYVPSDNTQKRKNQSFFLKKSIDYIENTEKDITILNKIINLIDRCSLFLAPEYLENEKDSNSFVAACYKVITNRLNEDINEVYEYFSINGDAEKEKYYLYLINNLISY